MRNSAHHRYFSYVVLLLFVFVSHRASFAQQDTTDYVKKKDGAEKKKEEEKRVPTTFEDRLFFGGNFGLSFGTFTFVEVSPLLGYRVTDKFNVGVGAIYNLFRDNRYSGNSISIYGPRVLARYFIFDQLYALGEYQMLFRDYYDGFRTIKIQVPALPLGLGYRQFVGDRAAFDLQLMYDLMYDPNYSVNNSPIMIRTGFNFNFAR